MKFIATTSDKMQDIGVTSGQLIFSRDDRIIYLDAGTERTSFQQIISVVDEETRQNLISPVRGFYFVEEEKTLWKYDKNSIWTQITEPPKENLVFLSRENFPETGVENVLYVDKKTIYQWDNSTQDYIAMGASATELNWGSIA